MSDTELHELVRDRELLTNELHPFNVFYGHAALVRRYAGWTRRAPLKAAIEHGLVLFDNIVPELEVGVELPLFLCHSERRARAFTRRASCWARAEPIGLPILYANALEPRQPQQSRRRLVLFPAHSSKYQITHFDVDQLLERVRPWAEEFDELQVCLYWLDVLRGAGAEYRRRGLVCVSAGHMYDHRFIYRLLAILRGASAVVTNEFATHALYAGALGKPVWVVPEPLELAHADGVPRQARDTIQRAWAGGTDLLHAVSAVFGEPRAELGDEQRRVLDDLGAATPLRSPAELHALLEEAEVAYRGLPRRLRTRYFTRAAARLLRNGLRQARLSVASR